MYQMYRCADANVTANKSRPKDQQIENVVMLSNRYIRTSVYQHTSSDKAYTCYFAHNLF